MFSRTFSRSQAFPLGPRYADWTRRGYARGRAVIGVRVLIPLPISSPARKEALRKKLTAFKPPLRFEAYPFWYRMVSYRGGSCGESQKPSRRAGGCAPKPRPAQPSKGGVDPRLWSDPSVLDARTLRGSYLPGLAFPRRLRRCGSGRLRRLPRI